MIEQYEKLDDETKQYLRDLYSERGLAIEYMEMYEEQYEFTRYRNLLNKVLQYDNTKPIMEQYPETVTWSEEELRDIMDEFAHFWKDGMRDLYHKLYDEYTRQIEELEGEEE